MKKLISLALVIFIATTFAVGFSGCKGKANFTIAVPSDTTNKARALLLLEENGLITLKEGAGITATKNDIAQNPYSIHIKEVEADQVSDILQDVDYAVINSNYAIEAGINPMQDAFAIEGSSSAYSNILAVKEGRENEDIIKALVAALESKQVADFIESKYEGTIVSTVDNLTNGYHPDVNYNVLNGKKVTVAASPEPHAEILSIVKDILAEKSIELDIKVFTDYVQPNKVVESGEIDANYFQHVPYLENFNKENNTHITLLLSSSKLIY